MPLSSGMRLSISATAMSIPSRAYVVSLAWSADGQRIEAALTDGA